MPRRERYLCDLCHVDITEAAKRTGVSIEMAHSAGGWGHRSVDVLFQGEVCRECAQIVHFDMVGTLASARNARVALRNATKRAPSPPPAAKVVELKPWWARMWR